MPDKIKLSWFDLWDRLGARGDAYAEYSDLVARYSEPQRAYHTLEHIEQCLVELGRISRLGVEFNAVELAIWYHDAVYDPHRAGDNEERSAELAASMARRASLPREISDSVADLILATRHTSALRHPYAQITVDVDLSILGQAADRFDEYERLIRREYAWLSSADFADGRSALLKSLLARPSIYSTEYFRDRYEASARKNISRSLIRLSA